MIFTNFSPLPWEISNAMLKLNALIHTCKCLLVLVIIQYMIASYYLAKRETFGNVFKKKSKLIKCNILHIFLVKEKYKYVVTTSF